MSQWDARLTQNDWNTIYEALSAYEPKALTYASYGTESCGCAATVVALHCGLDPSVIGSKTVKARLVEKMGIGLYQIQELCDLNDWRSDETPTERYARVLIHAKTRARLL
jgi:hypothetical protein